MAIKIEFDSSHNVIPPTLVLSTRNGEKLGGVIYHNLVVKDAIRNSMEMSFSVNKNDYTEERYNANLWRALTDFKLVWAKEWDNFFEITVTTNEDETTEKEITAVSLGEAELSQINLYNIEINTENDIARKDYEPTVLYNANNHNASLLHRITEKIPHYTIAYVDSSIKNIQRTFTFDSKSIYDAFQEIAEEMECVFDVKCRSGGNHGIQRNIYVYDLKNYGNDTNILLTTDALANNINYSVDTGSVKNCFRLEAGDDLMTATVRNCNPNGSDYIWYISNELKADMSDELIAKIESYNNLYDYYQNTYNLFNPVTISIPENDAAKVNNNISNYSHLISTYNKLIDKYMAYSSDYQKIVSPIVGYPKIMEAYYNTVDFYYYLNNSLMPTVKMSDTDATKEATKLSFQSLKNTAVQNLSKTTSVATVSSAILSMAKAIVDTRYQVKIVDESASFNYSEAASTWKGDIKVTNYSDEEDTYTISLRGIVISSDYSNFIQQKLKITLANTRTDTIADIGDLFDLDDNKFKSELKKYSLQRLKAFHDACQGCIDVLIQQGVADGNNTESSMYKEIYLSYFSKLGYIQAEMDVRQKEIDIVKGKYDSNGGLLEEGIQTILESERDIIQENLNFQDYLGESLWNEFAAYRREDTYSNNNYISDGMGNAELFDRAMEFIQTAKDEIEKSATLQHTIDAQLKNLLVMKEFAPIINNFQVGNWLRLKVDDRLFKLRLVDYKIDFENLTSIDVSFSDVVIDGSESNIKNILSQASSMATTYNTVSRQARRGDKSAGMLNNWVNEGLSLTQTKIIDNADNQEVSWDKHGLICREYDSLTDTYSDRQVKFINKGVYITDNGWRTAKAGIGNFTFFNPAANDGEGEYQEAYGVIADTIVGNIILGKNVGIYNTKSSITMDENGFTLTTDGTGSDEPQSVFTIRRKTMNNGIKSFKDMFYIDSSGFVTINGGVKIDIDGESGNSTMVEMVDGKITTHITDELADGGLIKSSISQTASQIQSTVSATYETKSDATSKKETLETSISQTADQIKMNVSSSISQYDLLSFSGVISVFGYGAPTSSKPSASTYKNQYYLNQSNGQVYKSNGNSWSIYGSPLSVISGSWQSQITANANAITSKVGSADVHTIIQQTPEDVRIAWNGISDYISFENAAIKIKNSSNNLLMQLSNSGLNLYNNSSVLLMNLNNDGMNLYDSNNALLMKLNSNGMNLYDTNNILLMRLNSSGLGLYESDGDSGNQLTMQMNRNGANYYNEGNYLGKIGTSKMLGDATIRGLTFNLETVLDEETARYMSWGYMDNSNNSAYTIKMAYYTNDFSYTNSSNTQQDWKKGFHFADDVYFRYDAHIGDNGHLRYYGDGIIFENTVEGSDNSFLRISGGRGATVKLDEDIYISASTGDIYVSASAGKLSSSVDFYMNSHTIYDSAISSSSDARLKKNISSSSEKALSLLERIDVSQFDWIETNEHIAAGFIAQQLQEVIPQAVLENPETTRLSIRTDILIPYIVKAIQELIECIGTDNKYKSALQSLGVITAKSKKKWEDKTSISDKNRFIAETKIEPPIIEKLGERERKNKKIILPG